MARRRRGRRLVLAILVTASAALMALDASAPDSGGPLASVRSAMGEVAGPLQEQAAALPRAAGALRGAQPTDLAARMAELEQRNAVLEAQSQGAAIDRQRVVQLDGLLKVAGLAQYPIVPAQVVAIAPVTGFSRSVTIDAGSADGLRPNMTVLNAEGLVGRITTVTSSTSTVLLAIDATATVGIRLENGQIGYAQGTGRAFDAPLTVDLFSPNADVRAGDRLTTFGSNDGGPYVAGVPVGEVREVQGLTGSLTRRVLVRPYVDFGALDLVGVVVAAPRTDPRGVLLPPRPDAGRSSASPAPTGPRVLAPPPASPTRTPSRPPGAVAERATP